MSKKNNNLKKRYLLILPLLVALVTGICGPEAKAGGPLGISKFEDCQIDEYGLDCTEKTNITLPVSYGMEQSLEVLQVKQIMKEGEPQTIEETFTISITKSAPEKTYPLRYLHTVSYFPYEEVIKVPHPVTGCEGCLDCSDAQSPTCGWTYSGSTKIPGSQGFCCIKSLFDLEHSESSCLWWRGERLLGEQATIEDPFSTAHCMRLGELYFDGYEIGEYIKSYEITVEVVKGEETHEFTISPDNPLYSCRDDEDYDGDLKMKVELIGDMAEYKGAPELDNYILYIPSKPDTHPFVQDYQNNMLLVPREELSRDGGEPDKVGVSFYTFRRLGSDCRVSEAGDGLHNQLFHKHNSDLQKLITNPKAETSYLVHGKKDFKGSMGFGSGMKKVLKHRINHINNSLVLLTMDANSVKSIQTESIGAIDAAYVDKFESMSENGTLAVVITNYGDYKTDYIVTVTEPTGNILHAIPAQARTLEPFESEELEFDVSTLLNIEATHEVLVTLKSSTGRIYDKIVVVFDTNEHPSDYSWDLQEKNEASKGTLPDDTNAPVITLNGPNTMVLECGVDSYVELGAEAVDDTDPCVIVLIGGDTVDTSTCGTYVVVYSAIDSWCHFALATRTVQVVDTTPPVITLIGPNPVVLQLGDDYVEQGATAADTCDDDVPVVIGGTVDTSTAGTYQLTYDAMDDSGNAAAQVIRTVIVEAGDTTPPQLTVSVSPDILWPPNHKMVLIICTVTATDDQDESPEVSLVSITMNEGEETNTYDPLFDNTIGDGHTLDDIQVVDGSIWLRAERAGRGVGRVYTITYQAVDDAGNVTQTSATVTVPPNQP